MRHGATFSVRFINNLLKTLAHDGVFHVGRRYYEATVNGADATEAVVTPPSKQETYG